MLIYLIFGLGLSFSSTVHSVPIPEPIESSDLGLQDKFLPVLPNEKYSWGQQIDSTKFSILKYPNEEDRKEILKRPERSRIVPDAKHIKYSSKHMKCFPNCAVKNDNCEKMHQLFAAMVDGQTSPYILSWTAKQIENICGNQYTDGLSETNSPINLNLSGRRQGPLYAEEPRFILVRREEVINPKTVNDYIDDPFIPPRGRKHNKSSLSNLFNQRELFVPNRGRRDNIGEMLKYDDLFFPNRGKKYGMQYKRILNCEESDFMCLMIARDRQPSYNM